MIKFIKMEHDSELDQTKILLNVDEELYIYVVGHCIEEIRDIFGTVITDYKLNREIYEFLRDMKW